jgi:hypothetical protein
MSIETESLEHKAEHHRARVDSNLEELRDRLSVGQIVDEVWTQLRHGQGGDMVKNLGRQARDNPLALGLIGAGVAWLLAGEGARTEGRALKRRYEAWTDDPADNEGIYGGTGRPYERYRRGLPGSDDYVTGFPPRGTAATSDDANEPGLFDKAKSGTSALADDASDAAGRVGDAIADTADGVADTARRAGQSLSDAADATGETVRYYGAEVGDAARFAADEAGRYGRYMRRDLYARGQRLRRSLLDTLYEEPLIIGGVALAVGAAIGVSLPSTRREDELLGSVRDNLRDTAYAYGEDLAERVGHVAEKAYEAASEEAEEKGMMPQSGVGGETLAEKAGDVVKAAVDKAETEAKKEGLT